MAYCDSLSWAGLSDWRLPNQYELLSIMELDLDGVAPFDEAAFPASPGGCHWSSSRCVTRPETDAWVAGVYGGSQTCWNVDYGCYVRCVRDGSPYVAAPTTRFTRTEASVGFPVVEDAVTGLVWQGCPAGETGSECAGYPAYESWRDALAYCEGLEWAELTDWRLPNMKELRSILDDRDRETGLPAEVFPGPSGGEYWSSTTSPSRRDWAGCLSLPDGAWRTCDKRLSFPFYVWFLVRCVRDGP